MRVNSVLSRVSGTCKLKLYDTKCTYLSDMTANEYFSEKYDQSFTEFEVDGISIQEDMLCIRIRPVNMTQTIEDIKMLRDHLEDAVDMLDDFVENYL